MIAGGGGLCECSQTPRRKTKEKANSPWTTTALMYLSHEYELLAFFLVSCLISRFSIEAVALTDHQVMQNVIVELRKNARQRCMLHDMHVPWYGAYMG